MCARKKGSEDKKTPFEDKLKEIDSLANTPPPAKEEEKSIVPGKNSAKDSGSVSGLPITTGTVEKGFSDILYDEITSVIGGSNAHQFFCMMLPGTALSPEIYSYDITKEKPATVKANESRLVNKLFDACQMTGSDNGRTLAQQYKSALDMLSPKLNPNLAKAKNILRQMLMTPFSYHFSDGEFNGTLQEVFYRLFDEWVNEKKIWANIQAEKLKELRQKYSGGTKSDINNLNNEFLEWYQIVAETYLAAIEEKLGKILGIFSVNDMRIIEGILDSGSGAEIHEARTVLSNAQKLNPDGGSTYPVSLEPADWFKYLDTSLKSIDLLETPMALAQRLETLSAQRVSLITNITRFKSQLPNLTELTALETAVKASKTAFDAAFQAENNAYLKSFSTVVFAALDFANMSGALPQPIAEKLAGGVKPAPATKNVKAIASDLMNACAAIQTSQQAMVNAAQNVSDSLRKLCEAQNMQHLKELIIPLTEDLNAINQKIDSIKSKLALVTALNTPGDEPVINPTLPMNVPNGFTQVLISAAASSCEKKSTKSSSASSSTYGSSFFFCGYSSSSSHSESSYSDFAASKNSEIQIGMSLAKVGIVRNWFNPGLFLLTRDMFNTSSKKIAPSVTASSGEFTQTRFDEMNKCILPCYPTAFVVARDVTIHFATSSSESSSFSRSVEDHVSRGGGFFCFSGSSSSSSASSSSSSSVKTTSKGVTVKFAEPQIIGFYLEATPADESKALTDNLTSGANDASSIFDFMGKCKEMLTEIKPKKA